jgi:hypothetical protein
VDLSVEYPRPDTVNLTTRITSTAEKPRKLGPVFLLLGPVAENPITTFNLLLAPKADPVACCAIDFERRELKPVVDPSQPLRRLIPLTYFTAENDRIGDETLTFTYPLQLPVLERATAIGVRLYVYSDAPHRRRQHRKLQNVLLAGPETRSTRDGFGLDDPEQPPCRAKCKRLNGRSPCWK